MNNRRSLRARPIEPPESLSERPERHAPRRCRICDAWLSTYNAEPICWSHQPNGEGVLVEVAPGEYRRFVYPERDVGRDRRTSERLEDLRELMEEW